jgi:hypothetical protein
MPPTKTQVSKLSGRVIINSKELFNATACEITPGGNGFYAVTIRQILTNQSPDMFQETYKGQLHIVYQHPALNSVKLQGHFLDYGVQDENGQCILSLFFKAQQEESVLVTPVKPSITLAK